jgi:hypothetical protein
MVEIRYGDQYEAADLAGQTVSEVRQQFREELGIPEKARARLNGRKVSVNAEPDMELNDDDKLSFAVDKSKAPFLVGALLLAMAITGGVFAFGFINASTNLNGSVSNSNFADVSVNSTGIGSLAWNAYGFFKGSIPANTSNNGTPVFNVDTATSGYTGDLAVTVSLGNADTLSKVYRVLSLKLGMFYPNGDPMDINESGTADGNDWVLLTLNNGSVSLFPKGTANVTTVRVLGGSYITNVKPLAGWGSGTAAPQLFCEVAQR